METMADSMVISRALTTVNAPLPIRIDGGTLLACLRLTRTDARWGPHVRAFFSDVDMALVMDLVLERSVTFDDLAKAAAFWDVEGDGENAQWIREMAAVPVAEAHGPHAAGHRLGPD